MEEVISFNEVNIDDNLNVFTNLYRRKRQIDWIVKAKPMGTGYEELILKSKGAGDLYLPRNSITRIVRIW